MRQNGVTLENILKLDCMKDSRIIAGYKGLKNTVSKANIMADPFILDWVEEGELLLMTAYNLTEQDLEIQRNFIRTCQDKGLSGVAVKIQPYLEQLPKSMIDYAEEINLPIIELHESIPFSDIMVAILKEIFHKQASLLQRLEQVHEQFMNAMLTEASLEEIAGVIQNNIKNPVYVILDFPESTIEKMPDISSHTKEALLENSYNFYKSQANQRIKRLDEGKHLIDGHYVTRMVMPIVVKEDVYGHIFTWAVNTPLGGFDLSVLESGSTTMALEILKQLSVREVEDRYRSEFLEDLVSEDKNRREKALERASFFKLDSESEYSVFNIEVNSDSTKEYPNGIFQHLSKILQVSEKFIESKGLMGIVTSKRDSIYLLINLRVESNEQGKNISKSRVLNQQELELLADGLCTELQKRIPGNSYFVAIGRPVSGLWQVTKSFQDAQKAVKIKSLAYSEQPVLKFDDLGIYKLLSQDSLGAELEQFYASTVKPLYDYDQKKSTEFVRTLEEYFRQSGNLKQVSKHLYTHYNTILYRIERIKKITGMDLEDPEDSLNLKIGLKIFYMLNDHDS